HCRSSCFASFRRRRSSGSEETRRSRSTSHRGGDPPGPRLRDGGGRVRQDLYYRLNVVHIEVLPLRARRADLLPLANRALRRFASESGKAIHGFGSDAIERIARHYMARQLARARERDRARGRPMQGEHGDRRSPSRDRLGVARRQDLCIPGCRDGSARETDSATSSGHGAGCFEILPPSASQRTISMGSTIRCITSCAPEHTARRRKIPRPWLPMTTRSKSAERRTIASTGVPSTRSPAERTPALAAIRPALSRSTRPCAVSASSASDMFTTPSLRVLRVSITKRNTTAEPSPSARATASFAPSSLQALPSIGTRIRAYMAL